MALRAVPDHPKFADLKARLGRPKYVALGCLEAIWHFTGRFTPQGNLGKYTDQAIEAWVEWDGQPGALITALIGAGWLDADPVHRLLVHDWGQHADKATKNALNRAHIGFCTDPVRTPSVQSTDEKPELSTVSRLPEPVPVPVPVPEAKAKAAAKEKPSHLVLPDWISSEAWDAFEEMRRKLRAPLTDYARKRIIAELVKLESQGHKAESVLNQSITRGWRGVFPLSADNRELHQPRSDVPRAFTPDEMEKHRQQEESEEREGYAMWLSMSDNFKAKNPWLGRIFEEGA
jgi:hypothetical protein